MIISIWKYDHAPTTETSTIKINSLGDHHQAYLLLNPHKNTVSGGTVFNYSDHSLVGIKISENGEAVGTFSHSGDTHLLQGQLNNNGTFRAKYLDKGAGIELSVSQNGVRILKGKLPEGGIKISGEHHSTLLEIDSDGRLSGSLESKLTDSAAFSIQLGNGKISSGTFTHKGNHHTTSISLGHKDWTAQIASDDEDMQWSFGIEKGVAGVAGAVNFKHQF